MSKQTHLRKKTNNDEVTDVCDETVKNLVNEITNDQDLDRFEKEAQLLGIIDQNELNVNQTSKIQRTIANLSSTSGVSYGQSLIDASKMHLMD